MVDRQRGDSRKNRGLSMSVVLGTLLVPLSAYAASVLIGYGSQAGSATTSTVVGEPQVETVFGLQPATPADLEAACGEAGMGLVEVEADSSISDVQQAALDALREICAEHGMPLPGRLAPDPIIQTVVVSRTASSPPGQEAQVTTDRGSDEIEDEIKDEHEDDRGHEDEDEDEHGDEDEHEEADD